MSNDSSSKSEVHQLPTKDGRETRVAYSPDMGVAIYLIKDFPRGMALSWQEAQELMVDLAMCLRHRPEPKEGVDGNHRLASRPTDLA